MLYYPSRQVCLYFSSAITIVHNYFLESPFKLSLKFCQHLIQSVTDIIRLTIVHLIWDIGHDSTSIFSYNNNLNYNLHPWSCTTCICYFNNSIFAVYNLCKLNVKFKWLLMSSGYSASIIISNRVLDDDTFAAIKCICL